jgi:hypothetical protein
MDWFWHVLWVCLVVIPIALLWIAVVVELFRRHDLSGWMKVLASSSCLSSPSSARSPTSS